MSAFSDSLHTAFALIVTGDGHLWSIVGRSLTVSALACACSLVLGVALGAWLAVLRFWGRDAVLMLLGTLLALPSV